MKGGLIVNEFSVYQWFIDGSQEEVRRFVSIDEAVGTAVNLARSVGGRLGTTRRVIITDGGDCCCWEWLYEEGIVFPEDLAGKLKRGIP